MNTAERAQLEEYVRSLKENQVWFLLVRFFVSRSIQAAIVHKPGEHGMDVAAFVGPEKDLLGRGYNILIQAKIDKLTEPKWRKDVLCQVPEATYSRIEHPNYVEPLARRILLVVINSATPGAVKSIADFNQKHDIKIEFLDLNDLLTLFDKDQFATDLLQEIPRGLGEGKKKTIKLPIVGKRNRGG